MNERPDENLIQAYLEGDTEALAILVDRHRRGVYGYIVNMVGHGADADDIFQSVWIKAIRNLERYKHSNFGGWLTRIARNAVLDQARRRKPDASLDAEFADGRTMADTLASAQADPQQEVSALELGVRIREAVASLGVEQREVFVLRTQQNLAFKEIAEMQGVSINTALARMQYALAHLRPLLAQDYEQLGHSS